MLAAAGCKFNSGTFFPLKKMLIHKEIVQKFTESQEKKCNSFKEIKKKLVLVELQHRSLSFTAGLLLADRLSIA